MPSLQNTTALVALGLDPSGTVGIGQVVGLGSASTNATSAFDAAGAASTVNTALTTHIADHGNPHAVTPTQIGALAVANNLGDLQSAMLARAALGLGTAATATIGSSNGNLQTLNGDGTKVLYGDGVWRVPASGGSGWAAAGNVVFVDAVNGNDSTAAANDPTKPALTLAKAKQLAGSGSTIIVFPGTYSGVDLGKHGVTWWGWGSPTITYTNGASCIISDGAGSHTCSVFGEFNFAYTATVGQAFHPINLTNTASTTRLKFSTLTVTGAVQGTNASVINHTDGVLHMAFDTGTAHSSHWCNWENGEHMEFFDRVDVSGAANYGWWGNLGGLAANAPTGFLWVQGFEVLGGNAASQPLISPFGGSTFRSWYFVDQLKHSADAVCTVGADVAGQGVSPTGTNGSLVYIQSEKIFGAVRANAGILYLSSQKIENAVAAATSSMVVASGGTVIAQIDQWSDLGTTSGPTNLMTASQGLDLSGNPFYGTLFVEGGNAVRTKNGNGVNIGAGGQIVLKSFYLDCTAATTKSPINFTGTASARSVELMNCALKAAPGRLSMSNAAGLAQTVNFLTDCGANAGVDSLITTVGLFTVNGTVATPLIVNGINNNGTMSANAGTVSGSLSVGSLLSSGTVTATSGTFSANLNVGGNGTVAGSLNLGKAVLPSVVSLADAATIATDASLGNNFTVTLGGNRTLGNPTNGVDGQRVTWRMIQDGTGSRTITLGTNFKLGTDITAVTLSTAANAIDYLTAIYDATAGKWHVVSLVRGY